ncbi:AEC family transporter [Ideonella sp. B7]|uniref:AEC family transporter n=1 Tax=Ideonella benzenivorans TaxID=2831643 RepID=UPI001CECC110|nr:AEC family transporter [Ideonella benzenivorans]MCA6215383.1 AEC family transporter [Ideonella benzenivorans]
MNAILSITAPFFALILLGWWAARRRWLPVSAVPGLNSFVLYFALPAMLLRFGWRTPLATLFDPVVLGLYLGVGLGVVAVAVALARARGVPGADAAFGALVAAFPNSGFMGVPLLVALLGPAAAGPIICTVLADMIVTSSVCVALSQALGGHGGDARAAALRSLRGALSNPLPWAIGLGALLGGLGWSLPGPVTAVVNLLADAASPVALFTIGAVLWRSTPHTGAHGEPPGWHRAQRVLAPFLPVLPEVLLKLLLHPALVWGGGRALQAAGLPLDDAALLALTLTAALPSASNVALLTERYGADTARVARIILASTLLAFASFSLLARWLVTAAPSGG